MKKLLIGFLTVSFLFVLINIDANAQANYGYVTNILDITNVYISDNPEETSSKRCLKSINAIQVEKESDYTFVLSKHLFSDQSWGHPDLAYEVYLLFEDEETGRMLGRSYSYDFTLEYAYFTFKALTENLIIRELAIEVNSYPSYNRADIMLYKGLINDFNGHFTNFKSQMTPVQWAYIKDYDDDLDLEDIIKHINLYNSLEDEIIILEDNYTRNKNILGEHKTSLMLVSPSNNRIFCDLFVKVIDVTPPKIIGQTYYELEFKEETLEILSIIKNLRVIDNASNISEQDIIIYKDEYSKNKDKIGDHLVLFKVNDESGNIGELEIKISVRDTKPPIIAGPAEIYRYTTDLLITEAEIKNLFNVYDVADGDLSNYLVIEGVSKAVPGSYIYTLEVEDFSGNKTTKTLTVNVIQGSLPHYKRDDNHIITYSKYKQMSHEDLINWLKEKIVEGTEFTILLNEPEYSQNKNKPMNLYYSYMLNNQKHYGRVVVEPTKETKTKTIVVASLLAVINITFGLIYYKRPKIHF